MLERARAGDPGAWSELYRWLSPQVLGYLRARGASEPEDVLGEVFVQAVRDLGSFSGNERDFRAWVFSIAHHRLIDEARRTARRPVDPVSTEELVDHAAAADAETEAMDRIGTGEVTPAAGDALGGPEGGTPAAGPGRTDGAGGGARGRQTSRRGETATATRDRETAKGARRMTRTHPVAKPSLSVAEMRLQRHDAETMPERFEEALRDAFLEAPPAAAEERHLAMIQAEGDARTAPTKPSVPARIRLAAVVAAAVLALPIAFAGLAFAGVRLPEPVDSAFETVGIDLPNQGGSEDDGDGDEAGEGDGSSRAESEAEAEPATGTGGDGEGGSGKARTDSGNAGSAGEGTGDSTRSLRRAARRRIQRAARTRSGRPDRRPRSFAAGRQGSGTPPPHAQDGVGGPPPHAQGGGSQTAKPVVPKPKPARPAPVDPKPVKPKPAKPEISNPDSTDCPATLQPRAALSDGDGGRDLNVKPTKGEKPMKQTLTIIAAAALASCVLAPAATAANESPNPKQVATRSATTRRRR